MIVLSLVLLFGATAHAGVGACSYGDAPKTGPCKLNNSTTDVCVFNPTTGMLECDISTMVECSGDGSSLYATNYSKVVGEISIYGTCLDQQGTANHFCCLYEEDPAEPLVSIELVATAQDDTVGYHQHEPACFPSGQPYEEHNNGFNLKPVSMNTILAVARGGHGDDLVLGSNYSAGLKEYLFGGFGDDLLYGYGGSDRLNGDAGGDSLFGGAGFDVVSGGVGEDYLVGEGGADVHCDTQSTLVGSACSGAGFDTSWAFTHPTVNGQDSQADWVWFADPGVQTSSGNSCSNVPISYQNAAAYTLVDECGMDSYLGLQLAAQAGKCQLNPQNNTPQQCINASIPSLP